MTTNNTNEHKNGNKLAITESKIFGLIGGPIMKFIGYPIGYVTLKLLSLGWLKFGPWNNHGAKYDISFSNLLSFPDKDENNYRLRTETVAAFGWSVLCFVVFAVVFISRR